VRRVEFRSGGGWERADACERFDERVLPGPAGGQVQRPAPGAVRQSSGQSEQSPAHGARGANGVAGQAEQRRPAQQVVRERGDDRPGGVGEEAPGREVRQRLILEVADGELDDGVLAVLGFDDVERFSSVGDEREQLPRRQQLALAVKRANTPDDEAPVAERRFGDLGDARRRVVLERRPLAVKSRDVV
jgi:hypothetical protein